MSETQGHTLSELWATADGARSSYEWPAWYVALLGATPEEARSWPRPTEEITLARALAEVHALARQDYAALGWNLADGAPPPTIRDAYFAHLDARRAAYDARFQAERAAGCDVYAASIAALRAANTITLN